MPHLLRRIAPPLLLLPALALLLIAAVACGSDPDPAPAPSAEPDGTMTAPDRAGATATEEPDGTMTAANRAGATASEEPSAATTATSATAQPTEGPVDMVTGTIFFDGAIELASGALLQIELRDISLQDVASTLIARLFIVDPGPPPVRFSLEYPRDAIVEGNTYAVSARVLYYDGSLAFINDTVFAVITRGNPGNVDVPLVLVSGPPDAGATEATPVPGDWVSVAPAITRVAVERRNQDYLLRVTYQLPGGEDCARLDWTSSELVGTAVSNQVRILEKRAADGSPACVTPPREAEVEMTLVGPLTAGELHYVRTNSEVTNAFTPPPAGFPDSVVVPSPIEEAEIFVLERFPPAYVVHVVSALPRGSSCSTFDGYAIERPSEDRIFVLVTHHEVADAAAVCTEDYPTVETSVPLGEAFESGRDYTVDVNRTPSGDLTGNSSGRTLTFTAQ